MEFGVDYIIRSIKATDSVNSFKTGNSEFQPLKAFLKNEAVEFQRGMVAQTYVCILLEKRKKDIDKQDYGKVIGYLTLTCSELDITNGYDIEDCPYANKYGSLPAVKIARLAIDSRYRERGYRLGSRFIQLALEIATDDIYPTVGCRFLITDAKKSAVGFYIKEGFEQLDTPENLSIDSPIMFIDLLKILN